eukprot:TRINITY_DN27765_c0_g1_i1.p2 TRINITY_DN27765_c0_g1~~TRINITY_DN27765_c0_g1_i1.p2  ORF type:complete len:139 (+),score=0.27 TRINITY_DN27765_c0_g1_i1:871-1287(+)
MKKLNFIQNVGPQITIKLPKPNMASNSMSMSTGAKNLMIGKKRSNQLQWKIGGFQKKCKKEQLKNNFTENQTGEEAPIQIIQTLKIQYIFYQNNYRIIHVIFLYKFIGLYANTNKLNYNSKRNRCAGNRITTMHEYTT